MKIYVSSSIILASLCSAANADTFLSRDKAISVIQARKSELFKDPSSMRDTAATGTQRGEQGGTYICIRTNAKNELGGYGGLKNYLIFIDSGKPYIVEATDPRNQCGTFSPAPKLNGR